MTRSKLWVELESYIEVRLIDSINPNDYRSEGVMEQ